jgi:hypothetical protein
LFKGVENMGGDLFQLWGGRQTINPLDPTAANLYPNKPYKPDLSNKWNSLCLDKVGVSMKCSPRRGIKLSVLKIQYHLL